MSLLSINPTTGETFDSFEEMSPAEVQEVLQLVEDAWKDWRHTSFATRSQHMLEAASQLRSRKDELARLMALEMGKPVKDGRGEVEKCAWVCEYYAENAERFLSPQPVETDARKSYVTCNPLGPVLAVMPWNFPHWQVFRFAAPALMAGNAGVLKHSSNVMGSALAIEEIFRDAGFPEHLFRTLRIGSRQVAAVIENPAIRAVTLTGSTPAGKAVAAKAGECLKKTVLELGGSDPYLILADADLEAAAKTCASSRLINSGQSCIAAKRFIVVESVKAEFESLLVKAMQGAVMGDPLEESTTLGPQARADLRAELHGQVSESIKKGARCLLGGAIPQGQGAFYPATVLTDVVAGMPAHDDELFGPVAAIISAKDAQDAVRIANDSIFGLGAAVFSQDLELAEHIASTQLEAGCCFVNSFVKSDPRLPFGGIKESGYGRELADLGIREFVNIKTVYLA